MPTARQNQLESRKDEILMQIRSGREQEEILTYLRAEGVGIGRRTLQRALKRWDIKMRISPDSLTDRKEQIREWIDCHLTQDEILQNLSNEGVEVSKPTLQRLLKGWNMRMSEYTANNSVLLHETLRFLHEEYRMTDEDLVQELDAYGQEITPRHLRTVRKQLGLKKCLRGDEDRAEIVRIATLMSLHVNKSRMRYWGRNQIYEELRAEYGIIGRTRTHFVNSVLNPADVLRRQQLPQLRPTLPFTVPGPDYVWSMDAHCKLEHFGFEIYAAIDAFSRHIIWSYCGLTARTQITVLAQYVEAVTTAGTVPRIVRSDRGKETIMAADAHFYVSRQLRPWNDFGEPLSFGDAFRYGTSKQNQRIESWWWQQTKAATGKWLGYFKTLAGRNLWSKDRIYDRIALLAVYMPIIRVELTRFVNRWNRHRIRKQSKRPHAVTGIPDVLYAHPTRTGHQHCGLELTEQVKQNLLDMTAPALDGFDLDAYLPEEMLELCSEYLSNAGFTIPVDPAAETDAGETHVLAYTSLSRALKSHAEQRLEPRLCELDKPAPGWGTLQPETILAYEAAGDIQSLIETRNPLPGGTESDADHAAVAQAIDNMLVGS